MWPILFFLGCFGLGFALGRKTRLFAKREPLTTTFVYSDAFSDARPRGRSTVTAQDSTE